MPVIYEDDNVQIIETVTANGKTVQTIDKPNSLGANREEILTKARAALTTNATYLAISSPSAAQNTAQAKALTRQMNAVIKYLLSDFANTTGT